MLLVEIHLMSVSEISEKDMESYVHSVLTTDLISDNLLGKLKEETQKDNILQDLYKVIQNG